MWGKIRIALICVAATLALAAVPAAGDPINATSAWMALSSGTGSVAMRWKRCTKPDIAVPDREAACRHLIDDNATNRVFAYIALGDLYMDENRTDDALALYTEAVGNYGGRIPLILRGEVYAETGDYAHALADANAVFAVHGSDTEALHNRCWVRALANQDLEAGLADCEAALKADPHNAGAMDSRGLVLIRLGRVKDAIASYSAAIAVEPTLASSYYMRGLCEKKLGDDATGDADIAQAIDLFPHIADLYARDGLKAAE